MKKMTPFWRLLVKLACVFAPPGPHGDRMRGRLHEPFLKRYGENFKLGVNTFVFNPNDLSVGNHVYIGVNSYLGQGEIELEDEVLIGNFVSITASNHLRKNGSYRFGSYKADPVHIGKGTWISGQVSVTAGCRIGAGCVVGAGAVVTKSFGDNLVIVGVPAKSIGVNSDYEN